MQIEYEEEEIPSEFEPEPDEKTLAHRKTQDALDPRYALAGKILKQVHETIGHVLELLKGDDPAEGARKMTELLTSKQQAVRQLEETTGVRVLEGVFDGACMIGSDGKQYSVPPNYASKSRLVEGDVMKLTIRPDGTFVYKQIGPIERRRVVGSVAFDESVNAHIAICEDCTYRVLPASVSFFRGEAGDEIVCLVPKSGRSVWAAVENIIKK